MQLEWDEEKNRSNFAKHGVSFDYAVCIFDGPTVSWPDTRREYGETRTHSLGRVDKVLILAVIHIDRAGVTRIISARRAHRVERNIYEKAILKTTHN